ncbi:MAG TPA: radical SAM family heme chaperone HemW [Patescibacteria group bacterium]|nr:radical SAM family heme chaperone HemW [Patescibacteria group bacterium]
MTDAFGIYLHWPFCLSKCPYCDFNSHVAASIDQAAWRRALLAELDHFAIETAGRRVTSIFFGGGTPSLMDPATTQALLERIAARWPLAEGVEITLEANPGTIDAQRFRDFRAAGVNRLSMGLQALNDTDLRFLGRRHDVAGALNAVELARGIFPRISFDLIYARPSQTVAGWEAELRQAIALAADHLSLYQLTIEEGTAFHPAHARGDFILPDEDASAEMFDLTQELCDAAGLPAYEVSNHAKPGAECRHNLLYWQGGDYLGIGPGAHGRLTDPSGTAWALKQYRAPQRWLSEVAAQGHATQERTRLTVEERCEELVMMGLRLRDGLSAAAFAAHAGRPLEQALNRSGLAAMTEDGFVTWTGDRLQATPKGRLVLNAVIAELLI